MAPLRGTATTRSVRFRHPFTLPGFVGVQPAGIYLIDEEHERIEGVSVTAFRRVTTVLHLPSMPSVEQSVEVDGAALDAALSRDAAMAADSDNINVISGESAMADSVGLTNVPTLSTLMARYGITEVSVPHFHYRDFRYTNVLDALAQAERDNDIGRSFSSRGSGLE